MNKYISLLILIILSYCTDSKAQTLSTGNFGIPAAIAPAPFEFTRVTFPVAFPISVTPIVVVSTPYDNNEPMTLRIMNVTNTGFDVIQTEPSGDANAGDCGSPPVSASSCDGAHAMVTTSYLAVTEGRQTLSDGTVIVAGINTTNTVQHKLNGSSIPTGYDNVSYGTGNNFTPAPIVLSQIQTMRNEVNINLGATNEMTGPSLPFMTSVVRSVGTAQFQNAIELSEVDNGTNIFNQGMMALNEDIGWIAITEGVNGTITYESQQIGFATGRFNSIEGVQQGCNDNTFSSIPASCASPVVLVDKNTRNGNNGGWLRRCETTTTSNGMTTDMTIGMVIDEDQDADTERSHIDETAAAVVFCQPITLPVTLSYFQSALEDQKLNIEWETSSETQSLAFEVWGNVENKWELIHDPIKSYKTNSLVPQKYAISIDKAKHFSSLMLVHIDTDGKSQIHGSYPINKTFGNTLNTKEINWENINNQNTSRSLEKNVSRNKNIYTSASGIHRIYAHEIPEYIGIKNADISLTLMGEPVARYIGSHNNNSLNFSDSSYLDFYAPQVSDQYSRYLKNNVFQLTVNTLKAKQHKEVSLNNNIQNSAIDVLRLEENNDYDFTSPSEDPWYDFSIFRSTSDTSHSIYFNMDNLIINNDNVAIEIETYGVTDFNQVDYNNDGLYDDDHHLVIYLNGQLLHDEKFDGHILKPITLRNVSPNLFNLGKNELKFTLKNDTGYPYDIVNVNFVKIHYMQNLRAEDDYFYSQELRFSTNNNLSISSFMDVPEVAYAYHNKELFKLEFNHHQEQLQVSSVNDITNYWIGSQRHLNKVTVESMVNKPQKDLNANYLVISHSQFINEDFIRRFNDYLQSKSLYSTWVDVQEIYDHYGYGFNSPHAIQSFIKEFSESNDLQYVLIVGSDNYDYHDNLNIGSTNFVPTWYEQTNDIIYHTPTDLPYVDLDNDNYPDIALGRWPVRTTAELQKSLINTINITEQKVDDLLLVSENIDLDVGISYSKQLNNLIQDLNIQSLTEVSFDQLMLNANTNNPFDVVQSAQNGMIDSINQGADMVMFSGHASPTAWTFYGMLSPSNINDFNSDGSIMFFPLACYSTYYLEPTVNSLAYQLAFGGTNGSAGIIGASTLSTFGHNEVIAQEILKFMQEGMSLGHATLNAKRNLDKNIYKDVIFNWTSLIEPSMKILK